jgi:EAL domain-containing protein (putative c-di-GMP-specific phosphodiesterase class I)
VLLENIDTNIEKLRMLQDLGLDIALDDFGKGYSSLNYLKSLPINTLKIDKSFIDDVVTDNLTKSIVSSIILIGHKMGHSIVAEGIEDKSQLAYLKAAGCNIMQGYLLSKPLPEEDVVNFINSTSIK